MKVTREQLVFIRNVIMEALSSGANGKAIYDKLWSHDWGNISELDKEATIVAGMSIVAGIMHLKATTTGNKKELAFSATLNSFLTYQSAKLVGMQIAEGKYFDAFSSAWTYVGGFANTSSASIQLFGDKKSPIVKGLTVLLDGKSAIATSYTIGSSLIAPKISDYLGTEEGQQRLNEFTHNLNFGLPFVINPLVIPINALFSHQYYEKYAKIGEAYDRVNEEIEKIKKIPVPDWDNHNALEAFDSIKTWFKETLDPINKRMEESGDATDWDNHNAQEAFNNISTWLDQIIKPINERINALGDAADWDNFDWTREAFDNISDWFKDQFKNLFPSSNNTNPNNLTPDKTLAEKQTSPIILDLNGDGITTTSRDSNKIYFDLNNNQFAERTAWASAQDGILVRDLNNNGKIDNGAELFGNHTKLSDGINAEHGFAALAQLDDNQDNKIDANDQAWQTLHIWQDTNQNGITDTGELKTLQELGIQSLSTTYQNSTHIDQAGNAHKQIGTATLANGKEIAMNDIWFNTNLADTRYRGDDIQIDLETALLPNVYAFGNIFHLKIIHV